ncbi:hypothetical protein K2173_019984 [Erythroxylum novogranatense]|uniref:tRNA/rRNA methyltransferase SpoU type domain-containing protein n=1 Tax=Erythroxylum novogranatense TaxID=1862640 RepID=A0AAV8U9I1_9ROSI|nr:hypothetical protein K2173_019984 [Erythroxylum novogranatense]
MRACKTLMHASFSKQPTCSIPNLAFTRSILSLRPLSLPAEVGPFRVHAKPYNSIHGAVSMELVDEISEKSDKVEELLKDQDEVLRLMKMERKGKALVGEEGRWFPYFDAFKCPNGVYLTSDEVVEAVSPYVMEERKERFRRTVKSRSYSVCLVVEGLSDFGNVSATFRSADALGFQSVHVVSCDSSKRYRENRHVSMGAEKWLDIELWDSTRDCFKALKSRGYRIATTHLGRDTVSIYDMDWSHPTAIVVGNEHRGISDEALEFSDLHCSIPMNGMVDSFNVSVAAGLLMHHAVCDRVSRLGYHGDLASEERQILFAEFLLRHSKSTISIAHEHGKRKAAIPISKL